MHQSLNRIYYVHRYLKKRPIMPVTGQKRSKRDSNTQRKEIMTFSHEEFGVSGEFPIEEFKALLRFYERLE